MGILLKLDYATFGVSILFFSKVMEEKPLGVGSTPLVKEGLAIRLSLVCCSSGHMVVNTQRYG